MISLLVNSLNIGHNLTSSVSWACFHVHFKSKCRPWICQALWINQCLFCHLRGQGHLHSGCPTVASTRTCFLVVCLHLLAILTRPRRCVIFRYQAFLRSIELGSKMARDALDRCMTRSWRKKVSDQLQVFYFNHFCEHIFVQSHVVLWDSVLSV